MPTMDTYTTIRAEAAEIYDGNTGVGKWYAVARIHILRRLKRETFLQSIRTQNGTYLLVTCNKGLV